jgi:streptogramin lyase
MWAITAAAQQPDMIFHHIKEKDGLSHNFVASFLKDSRGILWLGTGNGLNRYDGAHFYSFQRSRSPHSIIDNSIQQLCEDKQGRIWGGTGNGVFCYTVKTNRFKNYKTPSTRFAKVIYNITCDKNGTVWATGEWNIMRFDEAKDAFVDIVALTTSPDSMRHYAVRKKGMLEDPGGRGMWFATRKGLHFYDKAAATYLNYRNQPGNALFDAHSYSAMANSAAGFFWVFNNDTKEILLIDAAAMKVKERIPLQQECPQAYGAMLFEDNERRLWFSTWSDGILTIDLKQGNKIERIRHNDADALSIAGDHMWDAMQDTDGTIWLGTVGGISKCNPSKNIFKLYSFGALDPALQNAGISVVAEDPNDKTWWMIFNGTMLAHYFPLTNKVALLDLSKAPLNKRGQGITGVYKFRFAGDTVLIAAPNGMWMLCAQQPFVKPYSPLPAYTDSFVVRDMIVHNDSITYFNDYYKLLRWNKKSGTATIVQPAVDTLVNGQRPIFDYVTSGPDGNVYFVAAFGWIGTIDRFNKVSYLKVQTDPKLDYNGYFSALKFDEKGVMWLANRGAGINSYDPVSKKFSSYFQSDGLVSDYIHKVLPDNKGKIWCAANNRFSVFDPKYGSFYNFSLPLSESNPGYDNYSWLTQEGNVLVTVEKVVAEFMPERLNYHPSPAKPSISVISVNGKDSLLNGETIHKLELGPDEKALTIKFGLLTDKEVFPYFFEYQLEGLDDTLKVSTNNAEAVYNNLAPGKYTFRLTAVSNYYTWRSAETVLQIVIGTPFYKTAWFRLLVLGFLFTAVFLFYRYRIQQKELLLHLQSKAQLLEKEKALVMYENLKQHLNPHFLFNSLTSLSSLIRIDPKMAGNFLDKMSKVYRYILKNRDNEVVPLGEEIKFVQLYNDLQRTRFEETLQINMNIDEEYNHRKIAPVTLQNLVENAIKHNTADRESPLVINLFVKDDYLVVQNNLQRKNFVETSNRQGLANMESLYRYLSNRKMTIEEDGQYFTVKIPLI